MPPQAYVDAVLGIYELNRIELLRDVFVWAYERSCQRYLAVQQQLVPPDTFRLRYRNELAVTICAIVRSGLSADEKAIRSTMPSTVTHDDQARFIALALAEFTALHAGNAVRFGLRPLEFVARLESNKGLEA